MGGEGEKWDEVLFGKCDRMFPDVDVMCLCVFFLLFFFFSCCF